MYYLLKRPKSDRELSFGSLLYTLSRLTSESSGQAGVAVSLIFPSSTRWVRGNFESYESDEVFRARQSGSKGWTRERMKVGPSLTELTQCSEWLACRTLLMLFLDRMTMQRCQNKKSNFSCSYGYRETFLKYFVPSDRSFIFLPLTLKQVDCHTFDEMGRLASTRKRVWDKAFLSLLDHIALDIIKVTGEGNGYRLSNCEFLLRGKFLKQCMKSECFLSNLNVSISINRRCTYPYVCTHVYLWYTCM